MKLLAVKTPLYVILLDVIQMMVSAKETLLTVKTIITVLTVLVTKKLENVLIY